jgi:hypothetical protein
MCGDEDQAGDWGNGRYAHVKWVYDIIPWACHPSRGLIRYLITGCEAGNKIFSIITLHYQKRDHTPLYHDIISGHGNVIGCTFLETPSAKKSYWYWGWEVSSRLKTPEIPSFPIWTICCTFSKSWCASSILPILRRTIPLLFKA